MSTYEYIDLCEKAQNKNSLYRVYTFDIIDSKKMSKEDRNIASYKMDALMFKMYDEILDFEKRKDK